MGGRVCARARLRRRDRRRAVHCLAGVVPPEQRPAAERTFIANLARAADLARRKDITLLIEPLNPRDRPDYFLTRVEQAADIIAKVGAPNVQIQFDFYHVQIVGGDLIRRFEKHLPLIGHVQIAAVPSRAEPDEGEVNYPAIFAALDRLGWAGWVGCEYKPRARTEDGLAWGRPYGLVPARREAEARGEKPGGTIAYMVYGGRPRLLSCRSCGVRSRKAARSDRRPRRRAWRPARMREARIEIAERTSVVVDLRDAEVARLELLNEALDPLFKEIPPDVDLFDRGISRGDTPRLWIDAVAHVAMGRDKRSYRFVQDTRVGRKVLAELNEIAEIVEAVTHYVARPHGRARARARRGRRSAARAIARSLQAAGAAGALAHDARVRVRADRGLCRVVRGAVDRRVAAAALADLRYANSG